MPLTQFDSNAALIVIDLQKGIVGLPTVHLAGEIVNGAAQLAHGDEASSNIGNADAAPIVFPASDSFGNRMVSIWRSCWSNSTTLC